MRSIIHYSLLIALFTAAPAALAQAATQAAEAPATQPAAEEKIFYGTDNRTQVTATTRWMQAPVPPEVAVVWLRGPVEEGFRGPATFRLTARTAGEEEAKQSLDELVRALAQQIVPDQAADLSIEEITIDGNEARQFTFTGSNASIGGKFNGLAVVIRRGDGIYTGIYTHDEPDFDMEQAQRMVNSLRWVTE